MKKHIILLVSLLFIACEKPGECFESTGEIITKDVAITNFKRLEVYRGIAVQITQGNEYKLQVKTGSNLIDNIQIIQNGEIVQLKDNTTCNWLRDYGQTTIYITAPNIEEIYSKTERDITSNGILNYGLLRLFALDKDSDGIDGAGTGDFNLQINTNQLVIETNSLPRFYISGTANEALLNIYANDARIEAQNLTTQIVKVYHRGSNDMIIKPIQSVTGTLLSTGNLVLKNNPPIINVQQLYQGHLVYN